MIRRGIKKERHDKKWQIACFVSKGMRTRGGISKQQKDKQGRKDGDDDDKKSRSSRDAKDFRESP